MAAHWSRSIVLPFPRDNRMINQSGDLVCLCLSLCLLLFVIQAYKRWGKWGVRSSLFFPSPHHYYFNRISMSSPVAFLFSFKEDALAYDVVESMEQIGRAHV